MEGLIPFVYRAIAQYRNGGQGILATWLNKSPPASYMRLPGDSGRFSASDIQLFQPGCSFSACSPPPSAANGDASAVTLCPGQPHVINSRRAVTG